MVLRQQDIHMQKNEAGSYHTTSIIQLKGSNTDM
jgi:hypothetical protein